ncbi:MupA/Atu3671 family FMN-dependent luciferase-like monooxygenase [Streptomyces pathocidini]|uniref:MupA/Atu3671 family FMN-dependent luciferase-like monooxygenase n=1 Tax=Streptomyces pathocidini TaxID=1650571 RepID=A0ABW7ULD3_9ACTN|nr:MupA/Atu3671 family FMN-dependent luciferase-like monooxygenase [Streptomyces pathocidini]
MDFSLLYFANREVRDASSEYEVLARTATFADDHGFTALWLPERHFHPFGGAYPNPAVAAAALASGTRRIRLRAGSVVTPLHDCLEIVEDWAMVDNLSHGRVDLALATGWVADDFVLAPDRYADRRQIMFDSVDLIRRVWTGQPVERINGEGDKVEVLTYPRPFQSAPNMWITCTANPATFEEAGARGLNILTALLFQNVDEVAANIRRYRAAREAANHDPAGGTVSLMLHAFAGESDRAVREVVKVPFQNYLRSSFDLWRGQWDGLGDADEDQVVAFAFERYFRTAALFGSVEKCAKFARKLADVGVDEIACLVDFGVENEAMLKALPYLDQVRQKCLSIA